MKTRVIGFIGTGTMGKPMAMNLLKKGFKLIVFDINPKPLTELAASGAKVAASCQELASEADIIITMVPSVAQVEKVVFGDQGILKTARSGTVFIDMSTGNPSFTAKVAALLEERGLEMLDAPVSRGVPAAEAGKLVCMVGGKKEVFERCKDILAAMASDILYMGQHGMGHAAKLINNLKIMTEMVVIVEALALGVKGGLRPVDLFKAISLSSGNSFYFQYKVPRMLKGDFRPGATIDIGYKDLNLAVSWAEDLGVPLTLPLLAREFYRVAQLKGLSQEDTAALIKLQEELLGISLRADNLEECTALEEDPSRWNLMP